ncbi:MAG: thermonuclease family protein [Magnetospirillum sp. WYHS-4]
MGFLAVLLLVVSSPALADGPVRAVLDGDTLVVESVQVRLAGLLAPKGDEAGAAAAREELESLALGRRLILDDEERPIDRHGRRLAQATLENGTWLQGEMLRRGLARVQTLPDARGRAREMLALEAEARTARRGLWADKAWRPRGPVPGPLLKEAGSFQLVEGRVAAAARVKGTVYLNFDDNWRTDFTAVLGKAALKLFKADGVDPLAYKSRLVRVRGWLASRDGPAIDVTHPEQIEVLE